MYDGGLGLSGGLVQLFESGIEGGLLEKEEGSEEEASNLEFIGEDHPVDVSELVMGKGGTQSGELFESVMRPKNLSQSEPDLIHQIYNLIMLDQIRIKGGFCPGLLKFGSKTFDYV